MIIGAFLSRYLLTTIQFDTEIPISLLAPQRFQSGIYVGIRSYARSDKSRVGIAFFGGAAIYTVHVVDLTKKYNNVSRQWQVLAKMLLSLAV